ncbi:hypervirulence associated TUDOR domain-containing protein [Parvularcula lutaonensis]|uniref:DUF2945 domain-containing protein n=1 Tax=Parvularcula lutaonensis TaxID=491923 RepID=A0ABV7MAU2_9PROT|nr:DUF2945 domain-containing protein [Parvularcula lutaonensis]GGY38217.1 hypothetical protein GCM10007148_03130 [Parvularcula lutaonensis]
MSKAYNKGTKVEWDWGNGTATGEVQESFTEDVERQIDGNDIKREASRDCPAYMIEQKDGQRVLKSHSEVRKAS